MGFNVGQGNALGGGNGSGVYYLSASNNTPASSALANAEAEIAVLSTTVKDTAGKKIRVTFEGQAIVSVPLGTSTTILLYVKANGATVGGNTSIIVPKVGAVTDSIPFSVTRELIAGTDYTSAVVTPISLYGTSTNNAGTDSATCNSKYGIGVVL
jgi:hypothetical protein